MPDVTGYRSKMGVIIPSTNTVVEHDLSLMRPHGVTFHAGRMYISDPALGSDSSFGSVIEQIEGAMSIAIRDVMTAELDYLVMGMSAATFWGGKAGNERFEQGVRDQTGLRLSTGATACKCALNTLGVRKIAILSPYQPIADANVKRYFSESGFDVVGFQGLRCPTATAIAAVTPSALVSVLRDLNGDDVDAIVQVGTNLSMVRLAAEAEHWLGKPVLAINATVLWHALRESGFNDQMEGFGRLLQDH